jgi:hypothetical protein
MVLEFEWLAKHPELGRLVRIDDVVEDRHIQRGERNALYNVETNQLLASGDQVILTTTDTENYPLPDERLIQLQWLMASVLRMSGAGEDVDLEYDNDSPMVSPVASLRDSPVSYRATSPEETLVETPTASPPNPLPAAPKHSHGSTFKLPKWLLKSVHHIIPSRRRNKLDDPNDTAMGGDVQIAG